jgi:hypothetical protein
MKEQELKRQLDQLAREAFPDTLHPWETFQAGLPSKTRKLDPRGPFMKTQKLSANFFPAALSLLLALLLGGVIFFITPQGRALAGNVLGFFTHTENNLIPGPTEAPLKWVAQTPGVPAPTLTPQPTQPGAAFKTDCGDYDSPKCTVEQIRARLAFSVWQLAEIPQGFAFAGVTGSPLRVEITYISQEQGGRLILMEEAWTEGKSLEPWTVGASASIQTVKVGQVEAEYVKGSYDGSTSPAQWNSEVDIQTVRWVNQGVLFTVMKVGPQPVISRDELAALLGKLTAEPLPSQTPVPLETQVEDPVAMLKTVYPLSVDQAAKESGLTLRQPASLPEVLTLLGARYDDGLKSVSILYLYDQKMGPNTDGLVLSQQAAPKSGTCGLCGFVRGDGFAVDKYGPGQVIAQDARLEEIKLGQVSAWYVEGNWQNYTECCGWAWSPEPYSKRLRWQAEGMAYELFYMSTGLTKEDLINIAKAIK